MAKFQHLQMSNLKLIVAQAGTTAAKARTASERLQQSANDVIRPIAANDTIDSTCKALAARLNVLDDLFIDGHLFSSVFLGYLGTSPSDNWTKATYKQHQRPSYEVFRDYVINNHRGSNAPSKWSYMDVAKSSYFDEMNGTEVVKYGILPASSKPSSWSNEYVQSDNFWDIVLDAIMAFAVKIGFCSEPAYGVDQLDRDFVIIPSPLDLVRRGLNRLFVEKFIQTPDVKHDIYDGVAVPNVLVHDLSEACTKFASRFADSVQVMISITGAMDNVLQMIPDWIGCGGHSEIVSPHIAPFLNIYNFVNKEWLDSRSSRVAPLTPVREREYNVATYQAIIKCLTTGGLFTELTDLHTLNKCYTTRVLYPDVTVARPREVVILSRRTSIDDNVRLDRVTTVENVLNTLDFGSTQLRDSYMHVKVPTKNMNPMHKTIATSKLVMESCSELYTLLQGSLSSSNNICVIFNRDKSLVSTTNSLSLSEVDALAASATDMLQISTKTGTSVSVVGSDRLSAKNLFNKLVTDLGSLKGILPLISASDINESATEITLKPVDDYTSVDALNVKIKTLTSDDDNPLNSAADIANLVNANLKSRKKLPCLILNAVMEGGKAVVKMKFSTTAASSSIEFVYRYAFFCPKGSVYDDTMKCVKYCNPASIFAYSGASAGRGARYETSDPNVVIAFMPDNVDPVVMRDQSTPNTNFDTIVYSDVLFNHAVKLNSENMHVNRDGIRETIKYFYKETKAFERTSKINLGLHEASIQRVNVKLPSIANSMEIVVSHEASVDVAWLQAGLSSNHQFAHSTAVRELQFTDTRDFTLMYTLLQSCFGATADKRKKAKDALIAAIDGNKLRTIYSRTQVFGIAPPLVKSEKANYTSGSSGLFTAITPTTAQIEAVSSRIEVLLFNWLKDTIVHKRVTSLFDLVLHNNTLGTIKPDRSHTKAALADSLVVVYLAWLKAVGVIGTSATTYGALIDALESGVPPEVGAAGGTDKNVSLIEFIYTVVTSSSQYRQLLRAELESYIEDGDR